MGKKYVYVPTVVLEDSRSRFIDIDIIYHVFITPLLYLLHEKNWKVMSYVRVSNVPAPWPNITTCIKAQNVQIQIHILIIL